jgi:hypothetical protein
MCLAIYVWQNNMPHKKCARKPGSQTDSRTDSQEAFSRPRTSHLALRPTAELTARCSFCEPRTSHLAHRPTAKLTARYASRTSHLAIRPTAELTARYSFCGTSCGKSPCHEKPRNRQLLSMLIDDSQQLFVLSDDVII